MSKLQSGLEYYEAAKTKAFRCERETVNESKINENRESKGQRERERERDKGRKYRGGLVGCLLASEMKAGDKGCR